MTPQPLALTSRDERIADLERQVAALRGALKRILPAARACKYRDFSDVAGNEDTLEEMLKCAQAALAGEAPMPEDQEDHKSRAQDADRGSTVLTCRDCPAPYGGDGWCDVIIPNEVWDVIAPEGGVICFRCMTKRIEAHRLRDVPVIVASGPYADNNEHWRLIGIEHGERLAQERIKALEQERDAFRQSDAAVAQIALRRSEDVRKLVEAARAVYEGVDCECVFLQIDHRDELCDVCALAEALKPFAAEAGKNSGAEG